MSDFKQLSRSVAGLTVLVTGAASGMGRATARVFAAEGAKVAVTDFSADGARAVADAITADGGAAKAWALDVADPRAIARVVNEIAAHFGGLDIVVNNAGISVRLAIDDDGYDEAWTNAIAVMLTAHPRIIRAALLYLRRSKCPRIVNIASTEALGATALHSPYSAAKAGVTGLTRSLNDLANRARSKKLSPQEVQDGTFTITNPGVFGSLMGTPIINQPQVAIMGVGTIEKRPKVITGSDGEDTIAIRTCAYFSISFDHRVIDGAVADQFLAQVKRNIESFPENGVI